MPLRTHPPSILAALAVLVFVLTAIVSALILWTRLGSSPPLPMAPPDPSSVAAALPGIEDADPPIARPMPGHASAPRPQEPPAPISRRVRVVLDPPGNIPPKAIVVTGLDLS